jgi:anti-sigma regulatory factor (Ser/Thr protein kinase)
MTPMAPTVPSRPPVTVSPVPAELTSVTFVRQVRLAPDLAAAGMARAEIEAAIRAWDVPVDADTAVLLTSELVANAVTHATEDPLGPAAPYRPGDPCEAAAPVILVITCDATVLRVDVHDGSVGLPVLDVAPADAECGRGLLLVTSLSDEWGFYRTATGKAVYFTLDFSMTSNETVIDGQEGCAATSVS